MGLKELQELKLKASQPKEHRKYKPIAKISEKRKERMEIDKMTLAADKNFYKEVWLASPHVCQNCNCKLGKKPLPFMFHHLLPKAKYPLYRYREENIMILCLECHSKAETNIDFAPKIKARTQEAEKLLIP